MLWQAISEHNCENPVTAMVASITSEATAVFTTLDEARHGLEDGDVVTFSEGFKEWQELMGKNFL